MSEIHIGPHTRDDGAHGPGESHHTFDREIDTRAIGKWMAGLLVVAVIVEISMWSLLRGMERFDTKKDPELTPIERNVGQTLPPEPRLQVGPNFYPLNESLNEGIDPKGAQAIPQNMRSDVEDMQALHADEDSKLNSPAWIDRGQGRVRVPIDVAMQVIASRGDQTRPQPPAQPAAAGAQPAGPPPAQEQ